MDLIKLNRREIPGDMPPLLWWDKIREYMESPRLDRLPWYLPDLEYLPLEDLRRMRAKALVWREVMGQFPSDISCWWESRRGRRLGYLDMPEAAYYGTVSDDGVLVCGKCQARWSPHRDGSPHETRCNLCGSPLEIVHATEEDGDTATFPRPAATS